MQLQVNSPYIRIQNIPDKNKKSLHENWYSMRTGNVDIYYAFIELGLNLLNKNGKLGFITLNSHFNIASGKNLRKLLKKIRILKKLLILIILKFLKM